MKPTIKIAKDINSTAEQLADLIGFNNEIDRLVAQHPNATAKLLYWLIGKNEKIDRLVAKHPNATAKVLKALSRMNVLAGPDIPPSLVEWVVRHGSVKEKLMLRDAPFIPTEMLIDLSQNEGKPYVFQELREDARKARFCMALGLDVKTSAKLSDRYNYYSIRPKGRKGYVDFDWSPYDGDQAGKYQLKKIWSSLVPERGDAKTVQGQFGCIYYRFTREFWRGSLMNWGSEIAKGRFQFRGMVEFLEDRLVAEKPFGPEATDILSDLLKQLFSIKDSPELKLFTDIKFESTMNHLVWAFYAYFIKHPGLIPNDEDEKCQIAGSKDIGAERLEELSGNVSSKVRSVVANNPHCPVDLLRKLSSDRSVQVRLAVAKHDKCPEDCIEHLSEDDDINVRNAAASRIDFPERKREEFIKTQFGLMVSGKNCAWDMLNISTKLGPEFFLEKLVAEFSKRIDGKIGTKKDQWAYRVILHQIAYKDEFEDEDEKSEFIAKLANRLAQKYPNFRNWDDCKGIAEDEKCNLANDMDINDEELENLSRDACSKVRSIVTGNPCCSTDLLRKLSSDHSEEVRLAVVRQDKCPADCIEILSRDDNFAVRNAAASHPAFPESMQQEFVETQLALLTAGGKCDWRLMSKIVETAPAFFLEKLVAYLSQRIDNKEWAKYGMDKCEEVLTTVYESGKVPSLSKHLEEKYIRHWKHRDKVESFAEIAKNEKSSADELATLIGFDKKVDRLVTKHPNATPEMLETLSKSVDKLTREYVLNRNAAA